MKLDVHSNIKIESKQHKKVQQEFKYVGRGRKKRGLTMYAYDMENKLIYEVKLNKKTAFDVTEKKEGAIYEAKVNPNHPHIYALNYKNAVRKFEKILHNKI